MLPTVPPHEPDEPMTTSTPSPLPSGRGECSSAQSPHPAPAPHPVVPGRRRSQRRRGQGCSADDANAISDKNLERVGKVLPLVKGRLNGILYSADTKEAYVDEFLLRFLLKEDLDTLSLGCTDRISARFLTYCYGKLILFLYSTFA